MKIEWRPNTCDCICIYTAVEPYIGKIIKPCRLHLRKDFNEVVRHHLTFKTKSESEKETERRKNPRENKER